MSSSSTEKYHLFRESEKHPFAAQFKKLITDIFEIRKKCVQEQKPHEVGSAEAQILENRINELLLIEIEKKKFKDTRIYQLSMIKCRNHILPCIYNLDVPPDNNGWERAIRIIKVKQKVSGQFKTG